MIRIALKNALQNYIIRQVESLWDYPLSDHASWSFKKTRHFKSGSVDDLLDFGIARDHSAGVLALLNGKSIDVVLCGHVHERAEFRVRDGKFFMDFYTENPNEFKTSFDWGLEGDRRPIHVVVRKGAKAGGQPTEVKDTTRNPVLVYRQLDVPPFPRPLSEEKNVPAWWNAHRPIILLTSSLGPTDHPQRRFLNDDGTNGRPHVRFQGIRLLQVNGAHIGKIRYVGIDDIGKMKPL